MLSDRTISALTGISKATKQNGVRIKHLFRVMTHYQDLWMLAYANIHKNKGALTEGVDKNNTLDGMSANRINALIEKIKDAKYKPSPVRRVYIPKKNGKLRPLGIPTGDDKLAQEVVRILLEAIYEPIFLSWSHGFRPKKSCHTALTEIRKSWKGMKWVVDMDISGFYDNINHDKLINVLEKKIDDQKFIRFIKLFLQAGYFENWKYHKTYSGTPQGGIVSPILANIFLHELDQFMEMEIEKFNKGKQRKPYASYAKLEWTIRTRRAKLRKLKSRDDTSPESLNEIKQEILAIEKEMKSMPSRDPSDSDYRRLHYVRYADDFAIGVVGPKTDAIQIAKLVKEFINDEIKLDIAENKSGIHHIGEGFYFLGYRISFNANNKALRRVRRGTLKDGTNVYGTFRSISSQLGLQIPKEKVWDFCKKHGYLKANKPIHRPELLSLSDFEIISTYNAEMRGFANYYSLAAKERLSVMEWAGNTSLWKTLANKHKTTSQKIRSKLKFGDDHILRYEVNKKPKILKVFKIKYRKDPGLQFVDNNQSDRTVFYTSRCEIIERLNANACEYCGQRNSLCEIHHIHSLRKTNAKVYKTKWEELIAARARKTMVLCKQCHVELHGGSLPGWKRDYYKIMESAVQ